MGMVRETPLRVAQMQEPIIPIVADLIRQNPGTISLGQGVVYYPPPPQIHSSLEPFFQDPNLHKYQPVIGLPALIERVEQKVKSENGLLHEVGGRVVITGGGNMAFTNVLLAITDPDDEIILQTPYYFNHEMAVGMVGAKPVLVPTDADYQLQPEAIAAAISPRTRAIVTVSPNNPSGAVYSAEALTAVNRLCQAKGIYHIHDEAYEYFTYEGATHFSPGSLLESTPYTISLFSLSKSYGFASWRIGYMVVPEGIVPALRKIQDTVLICPPAISQYAAMGALEAGAAWCREKIATIAKVRPLVREQLEPLRDWCDIPDTQGAFFTFLRVHTEADPMSLVRRLIEEFGVAVIPGTTFGMEQKCFLRLSYGALQPETVIEGVGRFVEGMRHIQKGVKP
jgi:aspartate/methionine/tyrosine aminotransferase